jgi:prolyl oligopeptidase
MARACCNRPITLVLSVAVALAACDRSGEGTADAAAAAQGATAPIPAPTYPATATVPQTDDFFGTAVADPYRWLEDDVRVNTRVATWVDEQNAVTQSYLQTLDMREPIKQRLTQLWDYEKFNLPIKEGGRYFFRSNDGLQNQFVLYVQDALDAEPRMLIDPNTWSADGATALAEFLPSPDGRYVLYSIQDGGTDWRTLKVLDVDTGEILADTIEWVKFSALAWSPDSSSFFYSRFPTPAAGAEFQSLNFNQTLQLHRLGETQEQDTLVYARPEQPEQMMSGLVVADRFLLIYLSTGTDAAYEMAIQDLQDPAAPPRVLIPGFEHEYNFFAATGNTLFAVTNRDAPRKRIIAIDLGAPDPAQWHEVVPESTSVLVDAGLVGGKLLVEYLEDVKTVVRSFNPDGTALGAIALPGLGSAAGFDGDAADNETFYSFSSFNVPNTVYRLDAASGQSDVFKAPVTPFDPADYVVSQVFYPSKDGTRIPLFLAHRADLNLTGGAPTLLYGYGGFDVSVTPDFSIPNFAWMDMGGVYAVANIRGGGEYGKEWHDAGRLLLKQNVFDDFIAAAEYLIDEGITTSAKLAIHGRSNGGLLVGTVTNQRPDLFAAALPGVGVMDMLRFDKFTAGRYWTDDYGKPSDNADDFRNNLAYSPYHNLRGGARYPAILATTADTDDRVVPGHSFKYMAALQAADTGPAPKLIRIETRAGHGSGIPTEKRIAEVADSWAFIAHHTGLRLPERYGQP